MPRKLDGDDVAFNAEIIPLGRSFRRLPSAPTKRVRSRVIRPIDVVILLPLIVPLVAAILLGLLGWFVAWLATVASLVGAIVCRDLIRGLWGRNRRALDRQVVG